MVLTESWLTGKDKDIVVIKALTPDGYSLINWHRKTGRGGGIALVHKSSIKARHVTHIRASRQVRPSVQNQHLTAKVSRF